MMNSINNIPAGYYQGYIWYSDKSQPKVIDGAFDGLDLSSQTANPFIAEAQLYDTQNKKSYSIRFVDGHYISQVYDCNALLQERLTEDYFLPGFQGAPGTLRFVTVWREDEGDPLCEGMRVLTACENVFIGFKTKE